MNIFRVFNTTLYPLFVYLLFSRRNLVESTDAGASPIPGSGTKTGVDLSLKSKKATPQFDYNKAGRVVTYTAKDNFGFKSVKTGNKVVWETSNPDEYATKVVLDGKGQKTKKVTIYLPNNTTKVFKRDGKGKQWREVIQNSTHATGQPGSGTPASGTSQPEGAASQSGEGTTGGRRMSSDPDGTPLASSGGDGTSSGNSTDQSTHGSGSTHSSSGEGTGTSGDGREDAKSGGWTSGSVQDGSASPPPADGGSGTLTGVEESTDKGEGEDGSTQSSSGAPTSDGTDLTSGSDGSANGSSEAGDAGGSSQPTEGSQSAGDGGSKTDQGDGGIKLFGKDPNDANKTVELDSKSYDLKKLGGGKRIDYTFKDDAKCTLIKIDGKELWKHGDHKCDDDPKSVSYTNERTIVVYLGNGSVRYGKDKDGNWKFELANNLKTSGDDTPDPSSQAQTGTDQTSGGAR